MLWEAQFGDFANGAQSIVDEFISSGEVKWGQRSSVTLLLPHGHEGQGPDHTSGRPERFLQMCAEDNMRVAIPTTPANYFHLLRRQALSPQAASRWSSSRRSRCCGTSWCVSPVADFTTGTFQPVIGDPDRRSTRPAVKRVLLCSGKVYYDLLAGPRRARHHRHGDHPGGAALPAAGRGAARPRSAQYPNAEDFVWVQEEPANQGAWSFIALNLLEHLDGRPAAPDLPAGRGRPGGRLAPAARRRAGRADRGALPPARPDVLHRPGHRGAGRAARRGDRDARVARRAAARLRRRQPGVRDADRTLRDLAGPPATRTRTRPTNNG